MQRVNTYLSTSIENISLFYYHYYYYYYYFTFKVSLKKRERERKRNRQKMHRSSWKLQVCRGSIALDRPDPSMRNFVSRSVHVCRVSLTFHWHLCETRFVSRGKFVGYFVITWEDRNARRYRGRGSSGKKLLVVRSISKEDGEVPTGIVTRRIANAFVFEYVTSPARLATVQRSASRHRPA